jgi:hypothetical protein
MGGHRDSPQEAALAFARPFIERYQRFRFGELLQLLAHEQELNEPLSFRVGVDQYFGHEWNLANLLYAVGVHESPAILTLRTLLCVPSFQQAQIRVKKFFGVALRVHHDRPVSDDSTMLTFLHLSRRSLQFDAREHI